MPNLCTAQPGSQAAGLIDLATRINQAHQACEAALRSGLQHALECGRLLLDAKAQLDHGQWLPWLETNCEFTPRAAQGYMRVASRWPELETKAKHVSHLPYRQALVLLAAPQSEHVVQDHDVDDLPDLSSGLAFENVGSEGELVRVIPSARFPGYHYVAVFRGLDGDQAEVEFSSRPMKLTAGVATVSGVLKVCKVKPIGKWSEYRALKREPNRGDDALVEWLIGEAA